MTRRVGLLGGTFDPIHQGHLDLGLRAQAALGLTEVILMPAAVPPHRAAPATSPFHRFAMVAIASSEHPHWSASDYELRASGRSYTSATLAHFHAMGYGAHELYFIIGADAFADIPLWKDFPAILDAAHFAVVSRPGHPVDTLRETLPALESRVIRPLAAPAARGTAIIFIDAPTANVSSTEIRRRLSHGESVDGLLSARVRDHIERHQLYTPSSSSRRDDRGAQMPAAGRLHGQN
jgi:nicotinate-nucleotide adenylyltransferase